MDCIKELLANPLLSVLLLVVVGMMILGNQGSSISRSLTTSSDMASSSGILSALLPCLKPEYIMMAIAAALVVSVLSNKNGESLISRMMGRNVENMENKNGAIEASQPPPSHGLNPAPVDHQQAAPAEEEQESDKTAVAANLKDHVNSQLNEADKIAGGANQVVAGGAGRPSNGDWNSKDLLPAPRTDYPHVPGNYVVASHHFGVDTIGQSLRNANYQIRSDPPIKRDKFNPPWLMSTMDAEQRRPLEIGCECP